MTTRPAVLFTLDEAKARAYDETARLDDGGSPDHAGLLDFDAAIEHQIISSIPGIELAMDLLADEDGEIDGLRVLLSLNDDEAPAVFLTSPIYRVGLQEDPGSVLEFLTAVVKIANDLLPHLDCAARPFQA
jgi:hypothetical protein